MPHIATLRKPRRELDDVALAEGIARVGDEVVRDARVGLAEVGIPDCVAVGDADGAVHAADGDDGACFEGVGVFAEGGGCDGR